MSFSKAEQLLQLATMITARHQGMSLDEVRQTFNISHRTAQRMMRALELQFPDVEIINDHEGRRRWKLNNAGLRDFLSVTAEELAALELAAHHLDRAGLTPEMKSLRMLQDKILSLIPRSKTRLEPDADAILEAQGFVARPGPRPRLNDKIHSQLVEAIKACRMVTIRYRSHFSPDERQHRIAPLGFLSGHRRYLVAQDPASSRGPTVKTYRLDNVLGATLDGDYFTRPQDFDLQSFANKAFGVFQRDDEICDVQWRFAPEAAGMAATYEFHPGQTEWFEPDGSFMVRFRSSGLLEMAWYLYAWGDKVEVIEPKALADMVNGHQRSDFPALP